MYIMNNIRFMAAISSAIPIVILLAVQRMTPVHGQETDRIINITLKCENLRIGQYYCADPEIDEESQQAINCPKNTQQVNVPCYPAPNITCGGMTHSGSTVGFYKKVDCKWTNGHSFSTALLLSIFLGMFGIDRFYLGYPAIGLLKLSTLGFMFLGQLIDILLIALQVVGPSDESHYIIDFYGAGVSLLRQSNETYLKPNY